jgi:acyl-CoA dehydrogenase
MDIHGGKGICLGPNNYLGRGYQAAPIAITVEGANILTRNMIIFGQGVMRCHPYLLAELNAAQMPIEDDGVKAFDQAVLKHVGYGLSNMIRTLVLGFTGSLFVQVPDSRLRRYYQQATRFSSALAFMTDVSLAIYGSSLKRRESISARLGDIHSYLYLLSTVLKRYHNQHHPEDISVARYAALYCLFEIQERFSELLRNIPNKWVARMLRVIIFPRGERFTKPRDVITRKIAHLLFEDPTVRYRLADGIYLPEQGESLMSQIDLALKKSVAADPVEKIIVKGIKDGKLEGYTIEQQAQSALAGGLITQDQFDLFVDAYQACMHVIAVDDFDPDDLKRHTSGYHYEHSKTNTQTMHR